MNTTKGKTNNNNNTTALDAQQVLDSTIRSNAASTSTEQLAIQAAYDNIAVTVGQNLVQIPDTLVVVKGAHITKPAGSVYISLDKLNNDMCKNRIGSSYSTYPAIADSSIAVTAGGGHSMTNGFIVIAYTLDLEAQPPTIQGFIHNGKSYFGGYEPVADPGYTFSVKLVDDVAAFFVPTIFKATTILSRPTFIDPVYTFADTLGTDDSYIVMLGAEDPEEVLIPYGPVDLGISAPGAQVHVIPVSLSTELNNLVKGMNVGGSSYADIYVDFITNLIKSKMEELGICGPRIKA